MRITYDISLIDTAVYTDGLGHHIYDLDVPVNEAIQRAQLPYTIGRTFYVTSIYLSQMTVLFLYLRLFGITSARHPVIGMMVYSSCWFIAIVLLPHTPELKRVQVTNLVSLVFREPSAMSSYQESVGALGARSLQIVQQHDVLLVDTDAYDS